MAICGIYKITNKITGEIYVGQSVNIFKRLDQHQSSYLEKDDWHNEFHNNPENFSFEVLEVCDESKLNEREVYYINEYNSYKDGLNKKPGNIYAINKETSVELLFSEEIKFTEWYSSIKERVHKAINTSTFKKAVLSGIGKEANGYYVSKFTNDGKKPNGVILIPWVGKQRSKCPPIYLPFVNCNPIDIQLTTNFKDFLADVVLEEEYAILPVFCIHRTGNGYLLKYYWETNALEPEKTTLKTFPHKTK